MSLYIVPFTFYLNSVLKIPSSALSRYHLESSAFDLVNFSACQRHLLIITSEKGIHFNMLFQVQSNSTLSNGIFVYLLEQNKNSELERTTIKNA